MATRDITTDDRVRAASQPVVTRREETKPSFMTTEFWAMVGSIAAILVAAAQADNFDAPRAWTLVAAVAIATWSAAGSRRAAARTATATTSRPRQDRRAVDRWGPPPGTIAPWPEAAPAPRVRAGWLPERRDVLGSHQVGPGTS